MDMLREDLYIATLAIQWGGSPLQMLRVNHDRKRYTSEHIIRLGLACLYIPPPLNETQMIVIIIYSRHTVVAVGIKVPCTN